MTTAPLTFTKPLTLISLAPAPLAPVATLPPGMLCFYTRRNADGTRASTFRGKISDLERLRAADLKAKKIVSDIHAEVPLSENLLYDHHWVNGREIRTLHVPINYSMTTPRGEAKAA